MILFGMLFMFSEIRARKLDLGDFNNFNKKLKYFSQILIKLKYFSNILIKIMFFGRESGDKVVGFFYCLFYYSLLKMPNVFGQYI